MPVPDPEPVHQEAAGLGGRLLGEGGGRLDRAAVEPGDRGQDLEHRSRHVPAKRGPWQQGAGLVRLERLEGARRGRGVRDGGRVVHGRRGECQDLAGGRVEHHHRARVAAQGLHRGALQTEIERQPQPKPLVRDAGELAQEIAERAGPRETEQLGVVGALQAGRAVLARGVAHDLADRVVPVPAKRLAVGIAVAAGQPQPVAVLDLAPQRASRDRHDRRVVGRRRQALRLGDLPPPRAHAEHGERGRDRDARPEDIRPDPPRASPADVAVHDRPRLAHARSLRSRNPRRRRRPSRGAGSGSVPGSERTRSSPTTTAFASSDDPP